MDSLTQAVLGAACGELVLGKKIGNKALVWGALAGTIPDLDVAAQFFLDNKIEELIYHRGLTHSILFTVVGSFIFGWMGRHARPWLLTLFYSAILLFVGQFAAKDPNFLTISVAAAFAAVGGLLSRRWFNKNRKVWENEPSVKEWTLMFFLAILTHWLIDACTSYGTQIFEPFSSYRVSFNNIAIVDPLYTVPLFFAVIALIFIRNVKIRKLINWSGLILSTAYMAFSFYAKSLANTAFSESLKAQKIEHIDYISYPTMFNTLLWQVTVRSEDVFYYGIYSIMDKDKDVSFIKLPKNQMLLYKHLDDRNVKILTWFAQGYYNVEEKENGGLQINNLRFGLMGFGMIKDFDDQYIFKHRIYEKNGILVCDPIYPELKDINLSKVMSALWRRMMGEKELIIEN